MTDTAASRKMLHRRAATRLLVGLGAGAAASSLARAQGKSVAVGMTAMAFDPPAVTVAAGDTIQWTNGSFIAHTVTFDPAQAGKPADVTLPGGVAPFGSGDLGEGDSFSHTFTVKGTYKYVCKYHEEMGMVGTVTVT